MKTYIPGDPMTPDVPPAVFVSYAHEDADMKRQFDKNLEVMKSQRVISSWTDGELISGEHWPTEIGEALERAQIILLMVSTNFLASRFIRQKEMPHAKERVARGEAVIVPVILKPTPGWKYEDLYETQPLPSFVVPVSKYEDWEAGFAAVEEGLRDLIRKLPSMLEKKQQRIHGTKVTSLGAKERGSGVSDTSTVTPSKKNWKVGGFTAGALVAVVAVCGFLWYQKTAPVRAWLSEVPDSKLKVYGAGPSGSFQEGLTNLGNSDATLTARRAEDLRWVDNGVQRRTENLFRWDLALKGEVFSNSSQSYVPVSPRSLIECAVFLKEGNGISLDKEIDSTTRIDDRPGNKPPGFTHFQTMYGSPVICWEQVAYSPQITVGGSGKIVAGKHRIAMELQVDDVIVYRGIYWVEVKDEPVGQKVADWIRELEPMEKLKVATANPTAAQLINPSAPLLHWTWPITKVDANLREPVAAWCYFRADDVSEGTSSPWQFNSYGVPGSESTRRLAGYDFRQFIWIQGLSPGNTVDIPFQIEAGSGGKFEGVGPVAIEILSRGEPVWRGEVKIAPQVP